jgi:hypothetical protein
MLRADRLAFPESVALPLFTSALDLASSRDLLAAPNETVRRGRAALVSELTAVSTDLARMVPGTDMVEGATAWATSKP